MRNILMLGLVFGLAGCTTAPAGAVKQPLPANAKALLAQTVRTSLKDPYSIREPSYVIVEEKGSHYACVQLNAKNSFGAYTGMSRIFYYWSGRGWVVNSGKMGVESFMDSNGMRVATCPEATRPFPELLG